MTPIHLTKAEALPIMQEAFRNKQIQAFKITEPDPSICCLYAGPCIVGVCIPEEFRAYFDNSSWTKTSGTSIEALIRAGLIITDDDQFFIDAQALHDPAVRYPEERDQALKDLAKHLNL